MMRAKISGNIRIQREHARNQRKYNAISSVNKIASDDNPTLGQAAAVS